MLKIERLKEKRNVFDITVEENHTFYANGILVHNCTEVLQTTSPLGEDTSELNLCTLAGINMGKFSKNLSDREEKILSECCEISTRALDSLLSYQEYPVYAAEYATKRNRPLGIGIIGYAHWLAEGRLLWGQQDSLDATERFMEKFAYYLIKASNQLAKEFGKIEVETKYSRGQFPWENSRIAANITMKDEWEALRSELKDFGIRNATLMTQFPSETSSQLANETNGIEPPRQLITVKGSKDGVLPQVVPKYGKLNNLYETLWDVKSTDYIKNVAVFQLHIDQSISCNTSYDPAKGEITMSKLIEDLFFAYKNGLNTQYYCQVNDAGHSEIDEDGCAGGACKL